MSTSEDGMATLIYVASALAWVASGIILFIRFARMNRELWRSEFVEMTMLVLPISIIGGPLWLSIFLISRARAWLALKSRASQSEDEA